MCTSQTEIVSVDAHGKGEGKWTRLSSVAVYYDHPVRSMSDHAVVIDLRDEDGPPSSHVVLELSAASAARLASAIRDVLMSDLAQRELVETAHTH